MITYSLSVTNGVKFLIAEINFGCLITKCITGFELLEIITWLSSNMVIEMLLNVLLLDIIVL